MSQERRRRKAHQRAAGVARSSALARALKHQCPNNCGEPGPHFVPPSLGEAGFYTCTPLPDKKPFSVLLNRFSARKNNA